MTIIESAYKNADSSTSSLQQLLNQVEVFQDFG